jgi:hypothetical protein
MEIPVQGNGSLLGFPAAAAAESLLIRGIMHIIVLPGARLQSLVAKLFVNSLVREHPSKPQAGVSSQYQHSAAMNLYGKTKVVKSIANSS